MLFGHESPCIAQQVLATLRLDFLMFEIERQRLQRSSALNGGPERAPATARSLSTGAFEWCDIVSRFQMRADVILAQLGDTLWRNVDAQLDHGICQPVPFASDCADHVFRCVV